MNTETRDPNLFVYLTYQNNEGGTIGIAWVGVVCYSGKGYRVGISEYFNSDLRTAEVYYFLTIFASSFSNFILIYISNIFPRL